MKLIDVPERCLPADFAERLVKRIKHRRRMARIKFFSVIAVIALLEAGILGMEARKRPCATNTEDRIYATTSLPKEDTKISDFMLVGFFHECIRRIKGAKKKEEK